MDEDTKVFVFMIVGIILALILYTILRIKGIL